MANACERKFPLSQATAETGVKAITNSLYISNPIIQALYSSVEAAKMEVTGSATVYRYFIKGRLRKT